MPALLEGIRVLDLSRVVAGPYCAMLMADLGADVIKLERPGRGDDLRDWGGAHGMSAVFAGINRGKRGVAVNLQSPDGARLAFELARRSDVIVENFLAGAADKLGLGYAAVRAVNPDSEPRRVYSRKASSQNSWAASKSWRASASSARLI